MENKKRSPFWYVCNGIENLTDMAPVLRQQQGLYHNRTADMVDSLYDVADMLNTYGDNYIRPLKYTVPIRRTFKDACYSRCIGLSSIAIIQAQNHRY